MTAPKTGLPKTWHSVNGPNGEILYYRREHTGYEVHPEGSGKYRCELDGLVIGMGEHLTGAIVLCRDHMHEHGNYPGLARCKSAAERHWQAQASKKSKEAV